MTSQRPAPVAPAEHLRQGDAWLNQATLELQGNTNEPHGGSGPYREAQLRRAELYVRMAEIHYIAAQAKMLHGD